jgi:hypothetical protein
VKRVVTLWEDTENREDFFFVYIVEDVIVIDGQTMTTTDALEKQGIEWIRIVGEGDDLLTDTPERTLWNSLQLTVGTIGDSETRHGHTPFLQFYFILYGYLQ